MLAAFHHLRSTRLSKKKTASPTHIQGKGLHKDLKARRWEIESLEPDQKLPTTVCLGLSQQVCFCLKYIINLREMCVRQLDCVKKL